MNVSDIIAPETKYFKSKEQFDTAVGEDFIKHANLTLEKGERFLVALSHGKSPSGAYQYIFEHYEEIVNKENIRYTFVNSPMKRQRNLEDTVDAKVFLRKLLKAGFIGKEQVLGGDLNRETIEEYTQEFNNTISDYLKKHHKKGFDYVFLACDPTGRVAGVERTSTAFDSKDIAVVVVNQREKEITGTPYFLNKSKRIAFLATKADKRRPLAWLYSVNGKPNESPSFLRYIDNVQEKMTVFVDDKALTWPQIEIERTTPYGPSTIRVDLANPYNINAKEKLPVVLMLHGFLGLNSFDNLLVSLPSSKYIAAAMHYGTIPNDLPPLEYSKHIIKNIDAVVAHFGSLGHPVYIFDHSIANIYFLMTDRYLDELEGVKKYLRGRIGANPFFGEEAKHATIGFLDNVILPALSKMGNFMEKTLFFTARKLIPFDSKEGVRKRGINMSNWLISKDSAIRDRIWASAKERILYLMTNMDSLPHLNRIPIERALSYLPAKLFALQVHSALTESIAFDDQIGLKNMDKYDIPVLILKSERDSVAKYVSRLYKSSNVEVKDITNPKEKDLFREHLYHMVSPMETTQIIDEFIQHAEIVMSAGL